MSPPNALTSVTAQPKRILLLGPHGQVGWELRRALQGLGKVIALGRAVSPTNPVAVDLADSDSIRQAVRHVNPDLIVNAAAYTAVDKCEEETELAMAVNGTAPGILAEEAKRIDCGLVHYSTDYVFDGSGTRPWCEDDTPAPINAYGQSKLAGEEAIRAVGVSHLLFRVSWVHGVQGANFVKTMLRLAAERRELSVVNDQVGAPTSARVIADITAQVLAQTHRDPVGEWKERGGTIHLTCQGETNWHAYACEIFRQARERGLSLAIQRVQAIPSSQYPVPATRPLNSRMSCQRLAERFGLTPPTWQTALSHVMEELVRLNPADQALFGRSPLLAPKREENAA